MVIIWQILIIAFDWSLNLAKLIAVVIQGNGELPFIMAAAKSGFISFTVALTRWHFLALCHNPA